MELGMLVCHGVHSSGHGQWIVRALLGSFTRMGFMGVMVTHAPVEALKTDAIEHLVERLFQAVVLQT